MCFKIFYVKYFRKKNIIKVQVVGYIHINRRLHGKMKIKKYQSDVQRSVITADAENIRQLFFKTGINLFNFLHLLEEFVGQCRQQPLLCYFQGLPGVLDYCSRLFVQEIPAERSQVA